MNITLHKIIILFLVSSLLLPAATNAQLPECSLTAPVYFLGSGFSGNGIFNVHPDQPLVPGINPSINNIPLPPGGAEGLAAGPNLNSSSPLTTFYIVQGGKYFYYNGSTWVNTGHNVGTVNAINPTCSGSYIFNFDILTGKVWRYDGSGDAINITTISSSGCIFDVAADCSGNFYILKISMPQKLMKYNSSGVLLNTYSVTGAPPVGYGSGLCIVGNDLYYSDTTSRHGTIVGNTLNVETISNYFQNNAIAFSTDMASCPGVIVHSAPLNANVCTNQLPYTWNGNNYTASGNYSMAFPLLNGCDSIATLNLIVNSVITSVPDSVSICPDQLPFNWHGQDYSTAGNYQLTYSGSSGCDSIVKLVLSVKIVPPAPVVAPTVNYCKGDTAIALAATGTGNLFWYTTNSGTVGTSVAPVPSTAVPGTINYYVSQQVNGCEGPKATIAVDVYGIENFPGKNIPICKDSSANLLSLYNTSGFNASWMFNNTIVSNPASVSNVGSYQLIVSNSFGCKDSTVVSITNQAPVVAFAGPDANAQSNIPFQLSGSGGATYEWSPAGLLNNAHLQNPVAILTNNSTFYLTVKDDAGCRGFDSVYIKVFKGPGPYIPNAFSPNGDGLNDVFKPTLVGIGKLYYFRIYDRYGALIFETEDPSKGWDGTYKGKVQNSNGYVWMIKAIDRKGKMVLEKGTVMLVR